MKKGFLFLLIISVVAANAEAQSLKDLLYSGKLKKDSNTVIRKGDDLSARIDTGTKKPVEAEVVKATTPSGEVVARENIQDNSGNAGAVVAETAIPVATDVKETPAAAPAKSNNQLLKAYTDSLISTLKTEVLASKKIKKETYYLTVEYEIGADSQVEVLNVVSTPENSFLLEQVKERMLITPPQLSPALDSSGKPRKVKRKYNFTITKS